MDLRKLPFSSTREVGQLLFLSGQIGLQEGRLVTGGIWEETKQAISNVSLVLEKKGLALSNVVDVTVFLVEQGDYAAFNKAYSSAFPSPYPTRTCVTVKSLPFGACVELKVIARLY